MNELRIYTDGAYSSARNQGGIGIVFVKNGSEVLRFSKMYPDTTNNQMELRAVILALRSIKSTFDKVVIVTDSQYVIGCATKGWKRKKNVELWKIFDIVYNKAKELNVNIEFEWVHGHNGDTFNSIADSIAVMASHETILN